MSSLIDYIDGKEPPVNAPSCRNLDCLYNEGGKCTQGIACKQMKLTKRNGSNMRDRKQKQQFHKLVCYNTVEALQAVSMLVRHLDSVGVKVVDEKWSIRFRITTVKLITERHNED